MARSMTTLMIQIREQPHLALPPRLLHVIDEAVQRIKDGTITGMVYDPQSASLIKRP